MKFNEKIAKTIILNVSNLPKIKLEIQSLIIGVIRPTHYVVEIWKLTSSPRQLIIDDCQTIVNLFLNIRLCWTIVWKCVSVLVTVLNPVLFCFLRWIERLISLNLIIDLGRGECHHLEKRLWNLTESKIKRSIFYENCMFLNSNVLYVTISPNDLTSF